MRDYSGIIPPMGPFELKLYRFRTVNGTFSTKPVEVLRRADDEYGKAIVRWPGTTGVFEVWNARLS